MLGVLITGLVTCPKKRNLMEQYGVNDHLSPGINHKVQSESVTARRPVDDDLDSIGKYFFIYFYGYGALLHYDLERHIRRYSSSKLRNEKNALKQEC